MSNAITQALAASKKLLAFYNANTEGAAVNKFADRKTAERRCAALAEELQAEKFTDQQIADAITQGTRLDHDAEGEVVVSKPERKYPEGSLSAQLAATVNTQQPIAPRPKKEASTTAAPRLIINCVKATFAGTSKCQAGSIRSAVLKAVQDAEEHTITVAALDKHFGHSTRGYLQKLLEKNHLVVVEQQRNIEEGGAA